MKILSRRTMALPAKPRLALCAECYAVIELSFLERHYAWHDRLTM